MAKKTYRWDSYAKEAKRKPFVIEGLPEWHPLSKKGEPGTLTISVPSGENFLKAETSGSTQLSMQLLCGYVDEDHPGAWPDVEWLICGGDPTADPAERPGEPLDMGQMMELVQDVMQHFTLGDDDRPPAGGRR